VAFVLVDVTSRQDLRTLNDGDRIERSAPFTVRALVDSDLVDSVVYEVDGERAQIEDNEPWAVAGNHPNTGELYAWEAEPGWHTVRATPYSGHHGAGTAGIALEASFDVQ
jgi:hypothetical protein